MSVDAPLRPAPAWRRAAGSATTPERLRRVVAVLAIGCLASVLLSVLGGVERTSSVQEAQTRISALTTDSAELYRSLADADAMATSGYVAGGREPAVVRARYADDLARASDRLVDAAGRLPGSAPVATIVGRLPAYTGLVETARTLNREGLPLGQAYLGSASELMRTTLLPAADELRRTQAAELAAAHRRGVAIPFAVLLLLAATLAGIVDVSLCERRRTNRTVSIGLVAAAVALVAALAWWATAVTVANGRLDEAQRHGDAATALDEARTAVLQARSGESLTLVARSGGFASDGDVTAQIARVVGPDGTTGLLTRADGGAPGSTDRVHELYTAVGDWQAAHRRVRELDDGGQYEEAVASVVTTAPGGSGAAFERLDGALGVAIGAERAAFADAAAAAGGAMTGLATGPAVLALLAAAGVAVGLGRRIGEYR
jgi:Tfp pilus assembly protein PilN